jgi:hypothetical protein
MMVSPADVDRAVPPIVATTNPESKPPAGQPRPVLSRDPYSIKHSRKQSRIWKNDSEIQHRVAILHRNSKFPAKSE